MQQFLPPSTRTHNYSGYINQKLWTCPYVFVRNETKRGLQSNYKGPYKVFEQHQKTFRVQLERKSDTVSIDRLKAAHTREDFAKVSQNSPETSFLIKIASPAFHPDNSY